jgi:ankyrin repeat protein
MFQSHSASDSSLLTLSRESEAAQSFDPPMDPPLKRPRPRSADPDWKALLRDKFLDAAESGDAEAMATMLANPLLTDPNVRSARGQTPLLLAAEHGHTQVVEQLLNDSRVDVTVRDRLGFNAFLRAAIKGFAPVVQLFVDDASNATSLMVARHASMALLYGGQKAHYGIIDCLLADPRVDPNFIDVSTPLIWATRNESMECVSLLLADVRVDPNIVDINGCSAIHFAALLDDSHGILDLFLANPRTNVNLVSTVDGCSVLVRAAREGRVRVVERLVADGRVALPEVCSRRGGGRESGSESGSGDEDMQAGAAGGNGGGTAGAGGAAASISSSNGGGGSGGDTVAPGADLERCAAKMISAAVTKVRRQRRARFVGVARAFVALRAALRRARGSVATGVGGLAGAWAGAATTPLVQSSFGATPVSSAPSRLSSMPAPFAASGGTRSGLSESANGAMRRAEENLPKGWGFSSLGSLR